MVSVTDIRPRPLVAINGSSPPPPAVLAIERSLLSSMILRPEVRARCLAELTREHFFAEQNQIVFGGIQTLVAKGRAVDVIVLCEELRVRGSLGTAGGMQYLAQLTDEEAKQPQYDEHFRRLEDAWRKRQVIAEAHRIAAEGYSDVGDALAWARDARDRLDAIAEARPAEALPFLGPDSLVATPPDPTWVVRQLGICVGRPNLIVGPGYSAKSIFVQTLGLCVAAGRRFLGQFFAERGPVVHVDWEMGAATTLRRYRRLALGMGIRWEDVAPSFRISSLPKFYLNQPDAESILARAVAGSKVCILDSLRRSVPGCDENSSEVSRYLDQLTRVSEATGCAFVVVHHATTKTDPKNPRDRRAAARGSSAIFDAAGAFVVLDGPSGEPPLVTLEREPQGGTKLDPFHIRVDDVEADGDPKAGLRVVYMTPEQVAPPQVVTAKFDALKAAALAALRDEALPSRNAIVARVPGRRDATLEAIDTLIREGRIVEAGGFFRAV